jgi:hypothetical protein
LCCDQCLHPAGTERCLSVKSGRGEAEAIAKFIRGSVAATSKGVARHLRIYFNPVSRAGVNTGDLYYSASKLKV